MRFPQSLATGLWGLVSACAWAQLVVMAMTPILMAQELGPLTPAENFVLSELKAGKIADLSAFASAPKDRILRHAFVEDLITGRYPYPEIQRRGVSIVKAAFTETVEVSSTSIPFRVWLNSCEFEHGIDFSYTKFAHELSLGGSHFGKSPAGAPDNKDVQAYFKGMKVDGETTFSNAVFYVPLDLTDAEFGTDLDFDNVDYEASESADFDRLTAKGLVSLTSNHFSGKLDFTDADLFELFLKDPTAAIDLDLSQTHIERGATLSHVQLSSWQAGSLVAHGLVTLDCVTSAGRVNLSHSHFQNLVIIGFDEWLKLKLGTLNLEGFSFDTLDIGNTNVALPAARMLKLIKESVPFSPQPYLELEKYLRAHGDIQEADDVYVAMRQGQRESLSWINRPWDFLLDVMLGYGTETWRTVLCAIVVIIVGAFVFAPGRMQWTNREQAPTRYSRVWYSLDEFAPVIDLGEAKNWGAKQDQHWALNYARFQRIAGWILLPLILGAITGIVK